MFTQFNIKLKLTKKHENLLEHDIEIRNLASDGLAEKENIHRDNQLFH